MKNLIRAVGALSLGAASLAVTNSAVAAEGGDKPWTASASLRGFYDDNIFTSPVASVSSWGFDIAPSVSYGRTVDNTSFDLSYGYTARWFENRPGDAWDQIHDAKAGLTHKFSDRFKVVLTDNFVSAQDPEQQLGGGGLFLRAKGDNIFNAANASATVGLTEVLEAVVGYRNNFVDYDDQAFAGALNRIEHLPSLDLNYLWKPTTSLGVGYQFGIIDYDTAARSYDTHIVYAGARHTFNQNFMGSLNVGAQITDYDLGGNSEATPYIDARLSYLYAPSSEISIAIKHTLNATDVFLDPNNPLVVLASNQETTLFQVRWKHAFTAKIHASAIGQFQSSDFNGGTLNGSEDFWTMGGKITYLLTRQVSLDLSYYHDNLTSDAGRGYQRNRVSLGATASF